jgi:hypothetical protein
MNKKILVTVKTYPSLSNKYGELVCTAGMTEDGEWIRIYPVPFRKIDYYERYHKYQWIELDLKRNTSDFRPESFRPIDYTKIICGEKIKADGKSWSKRRKLILRKVYYDMNLLISEAKNKDLCTSLATFKPAKITGFVIEKDSRNWDEKKLAQFKQGDLFDRKDFKTVEKIPYKFFYKFNDVEGKKSKLMIEDWEVGQLYLNCLKRHSGNEEKACSDVRKKYFDDFAKTKDIYLFLGTTQTHHYVSLNPFIIIGIFNPKYESRQKTLL